jgi:hypothetical protein
MIDAANLIKHPKRRGEWAELRFMAAAAEHGLSISKPWGDSDRYDVGVEHNGQYRRVQVKSITYTMRRSYCCWVGTAGRARGYTANDLDFFAIFIVPEEAWYIVPIHMALATRSRTICITPGIKSNRHEIYREAWHLLRSQRFEAGGSQVVVEGEFFQVE